MQLIKILFSKIHNVKVTEANLNYVGSITIDQDVMEAAGLFPWQEVFIVNNNNGARFETYVIPGLKGSRKICLNGSAARQVQVGDEIIVMNYRMVNLSDVMNGNKGTNKSIRAVSASEYYLDSHNPLVVMLTGSGIITQFNAVGEEEDKFLREQNGEIYKQNQKEITNE